MSNEPAGSLDQDESVTAEMIARRKTQLDLHRFSRVNKSLLFATLVGLAVAMAAIWYFNQQRLNDVAANLLTLADQAEVEEDWQLLRTRLQRYLAIRSDDAKVMQRLADVYHDRAETLEEIRAGMKLYSRCQASYPPMSDDYQRNYLKYLSMQARLDPTASIQGLDELIPKIQETQNLVTESTQPLSQNTIKAIRLRIMVREQLLPMLVDDDQTEGRQHLIDDYEQLIAMEPGEPRLRQNLAFQYQMHAHSVERFDMELAQQMRTKADQLMNSVTNSNMNDIDVLMRRFEYGRRFADTGNANTSDLQRILELDRNNPQALLYLAMLLSEPSSETGETSVAALKAAKEFLHESIENLPQEPYALVSLANIQTRLNDQNAAFETLQKAAALYPESDIVCVAQASMAISQKRFDDVKKEIDTLRRIANKARVYDRSRSREINLAKVQHAHADVLEAELLIESKPATHDHSATLLLLKNVDLPSLQSHGRADVLQQAGQLFARLNSWESAIEPLERARNTGAISIPSSFLLARCYQQCDDPKRAMELYRELTSRQLPTSQARTAWFGLGMINLQTRLDDVERGDRLQEAQQALDRMKIVAPASLETFLLKTHLQLATGTADRSTVISQLQSVESRFSSETQYWMLCADVYRTFDDFARLRVAEQRLAESVGGMPDKLVPGDKTVPTETMESLNLTAHLSQEDLDHLEEVAGSWDQSDPDQRLMLIRRWCDEVPNSIAARFSLANLGITTKQLAIVDEAVELLREVDTVSDAFLEIAEIHRDLIAFRGGDALAGEQAVRKAVALLQEHPDHPVFLQLAAFCEETSADLAAASEHYRQAVEHGASQAAIDGRIRTLIHQRKWDQALEFIEQSSPETWAQPDRLELAVHVLCHHRKFDEAARMIRATAGQSPLSAQGHYLIAMTLMAESKSEHVVQAHQHLQAAVQREPGNLGYRISLFHLQINYSPELWSYQSCICANQIRWLLQSYEKEFAPSWPALILAETLRFGGKIGDAEDLFRKAVAIESDLDDRSWIPQPILSRHAMATAAPVTPAIAWLAGAENARTLFAIQSLWHRDDANDLEISEDDVRLQTLLALRRDEPLTAIQHLESIPKDEQGVGDHLFLAALFDRTGNEQAADGHRADCLEKSQQRPEVVEQLLADAMAKKNFEFAKRCLDERKSQGDTSVHLHVSQSRIDLATETFPADLEGWLSERKDELSSDSDRKQFFDEILNVLADQGKAKLAMKALEHSVTNLAGGELTTMLWAASQKALASRVMRFLNDEDHLVSASDQTEMLYRLIQHLPESSPHLERLGELAIGILDSSPKLEPIQWIKLGYVLEHLELPELAISACEKALPNDGSPSLFEHYIIWLRSGYLRNLSKAQTELDRLVRVFGPRDDLMDTRVVLFLRDQNAAAAAEISRDLALHDTLNRMYQANDRLASALLQPEDEREKALIEVEQRYGSELSLLAKKILRDHLTLD